MADFAAEVRRLMTERGMSLRRLAKAASYDPSYLSKVLSGHKPSSPYLAARLDDALGADGTIRDATQQPPPRPTRKAGTPGRKPSGAVEALQVAMGGDPAGPDIGADGLAELVQHYAHTLAVAPSPAVYGELLSARSFAGMMLGRSAPRQRPDLTVTAGWLSSLLATSAADLGDHAAAVIWCADTERRGRDSCYPDLLGWAALTRSLIAWYQGDPLASAAVARRGQADGQPGSIAHAKLAAQEMRCRAMLGDAAGMTDARRRAAAAMARLGPPAPCELTAEFGVDWIPRADGRGNEIRGVTQAQLDAYSTRTVQVHEKERELARAWARKHGRAPTSRELLHIASDATLLSRQGKDAGPVDWDALAARWDATLGGELAGIAPAVSNARGPDADTRPHAERPGPGAPPSREAQARALAKALTLVSDRHPAWTRHDLLKHLALVMPPQTRQMSPEEAQELLLGLADEALSGRTGEVVSLEAPEWPPLPAAG
jgi:transcriptional regulator with XRE-family HTH domain